MYLIKATYIQYTIKFPVMQDEERVFSSFFMRKMSIWGLARLFLVCYNINNKQETRL